MNILMIFLLFVLMAVGFGLICSVPIMLLWNGCFVGAITGVNAITWLQAWGLMVLFNLLFKPTITNKS
jgi:uncharacterized membrane protein YjjB (DUF3815 family)